MAPMTIGLPVGIGACSVWRTNIRWRVAAVCMTTFYGAESLVFVGTMACARWEMRGLWPKVVY